MDQATLRLLDANLNRSREALRVMEDYARFVLDDAALSRLAKQMRHDLADLAQAISPADLIAARDIVGDVGAEITTASEGRRQGGRDVLIAAAKRLTEALRCLEEYSKIDHPRAATQFESLRYGAYDLEKRLLIRSDPAGRFSQVKLYVLLTEQLCSGPILEVAAAIAAAGADCIQLREKDKSDADLLALATRLAAICRQNEVLFALNDRPDLAVLAGADVLHLGQDDISVAQARKIVPPAMAVGRSTHNPAEITAAIAESPDYLAVGSIFPSPTKPDVPVAGPDLIRQARQLWARPIIAIGGITADNASQALAAGADGVALCQAVIGHSDPAAAVSTLRQALTTAAQP